MNQKPDPARGVSTIEYLLVVVSLTTLLVGIAATLQPFPSGNVANIHPATGYARASSASGTPTGTDPAADSRIPAETHWSRTGALGWQLLFLTGFTICAVLVISMARGHQQESTEFRRRVNREELEQTCHVMTEKRTAVQDVVSRNWSSVLKSDLTVGEIMSATVVTVPMSESVQTLKATMEQQPIHHILVIDDMQNLVGIISDRDVRYAPPSATRAREIMTTDPVAIMPHMDVKQAISMMLKLRFSALPVVQGGRKVCGILTSSDLLATLQCTLGVLFEISCLLENENAAPMVQRELSQTMASSLTRSPK